MKRIAFAFAALLAAACSPATEEAPTGPVAQMGSTDVTPEREPLKANADVLARERFGGDITQETVFFGDFNSDGVEDVLGIYQLNDGAAPVAMVMWNEGGQLSRRRDVRIEGQNPREAMFSDGRVHMTVDVNGEPQQIEIFAD